MNTFLGQAANIILSKHKLADFKDLEIILPSRRAVFYFLKELNLLASQPFFAPEVISIDDYIVKNSNLEPLDNVALYFKMFDIFKELDENIKFENFVNWAPILLKDFENIDLALVADPHLLFRYMSEAEAIKRWDIKIELTANTNDYFDFFEKISILYTKFKESLSRDGHCYKGMAYRALAENINNIEGLYLKKKYFVGLNALSKAEETIVQTLVKSNRAECIWDTDEYYMDSNNKAGKKLRLYKQSGKFGTWNFVGNHLLHSKKNINVFKTSNQSLQAKLAAQLAKENTAKKQVIVVLDEGQFVPLMVNLPAIGIDFNITMGLPITNSIIFNLISDFIDVQLKNNAQKFSLRAELFQKLLKNKILRCILLQNHSEVFIKDLDKRILEEQIIFVNKEGLNIKNELVDNFFIKLDVNQTLEVLRKICEQALAVINPEVDILEHEFIKILKAKLLIIQPVIGQQGQFTIRDLKFLFNELIKNEKVPFVGETTSNLQIMSMLETRCLDFETVTILSLNEGNLPSAQKNNTLIPFDASLFLDMPVYTDQDAIMAYHFFRLLQRAENINFIYLANGGSGVGVLEKSRMISQIEEELLPLNPNISLSYKTIEFDGFKNKISESIIIEKTEEIISKIRHYLINKGFFPTAINNLISCELKFYWKEIERIRQNDDLDSIFRAHVFGNIIHFTLEEIEKSYITNDISKLDLERMHKSIALHLNKIVSIHFSHFETKTGLNSVFLEIAERILNEYYSIQIRNYRANSKILALEKTLSHVIACEYNNEIVKLRISGKVDKIEKKGNVVNIIDYKTGTVSKEEISKGKSSVEDALMKNDKSIFRQLLVYKYLAGKDAANLGINSDDCSIVPKIVSFRNLNADLVQDFELDTIKTNELIENLLINLSQKLLDKNKAIIQTSDLKVCETCDFKVVCNR